MRGIHCRFTVVASAWAQFLAKNYAGIPMSELSESASSHDSQRAGRLSGDRNRGAELAVKADRMLARYPVDVREQISELLQVLAAIKRSEAIVTGSRASIGICRNKKTCARLRAAFNRIIPTTQK